ncbi:MAG TPA: hypothetical protein VK024_02320, partial [Actinomycetaceae bacterium]|nr:hypothetical protein [Actinomycetaceae bacterium]
MAAPDGGDASSEPAESELFELLQDTAADVDVDADADDAVTDEDDPGAGIEAEDAEPSADDAEARTDEAGSDESSDDATEEGATEDDGDASEADAPDAPEPATSETPADDAADSSDFATLQNNDDPGFEIQQIPANHTTIRIETGGARAGPNSVNGAGEGLVFYLHDRPRNSPPSADATSDLICTTGEDGACEIVVPNQTGGNILNPAGYWITMSTQDTAEWQRIRQLGVGVYTGPKDDQPYRFHTGRVSGQSTTHTVTADSWVDNTHAGMGWMVRATNPPLPPTCGLNTAVVIDRSTSIDAGEMNTLKGAAKAFVGEGGLGGTPSVVSLFSFGTSAEVLGLDISLVNQAGINQASSLIDSIPVAPASSPQYTNWDQALRTVANNGPFDLVIFVTDGDPTTFGNGGTFSSNVTFQALEHAVASANQVKAQTGPAGGHTRIIGLGIAMTSNSYLNLQALTGPNGGNYGDPTADADFYLVDEFEELEGRLAQLATDACAGTLTVSKEIVDAQGTVIDADPAGWEFTATTDEEVLVVNGGTASSHSLTTPDDSGAVNFGIDFSDDQNPVDVTVAETQQSGFELVPRSDGSHARCTVPTGDGPREVDVTNVGSLGFTVEVGWQDIVTCVVQNRATPSDVTVEKKWVIDGDNPIPHADRPDGWNAQLTLTGPGTTGATDQDWGTARTGYNAGDTVTISESTSGLPPGCTVDQAKVTNANG